jgi:tRNA pseudouridine38-40 synthase
VNLAALVAYDGTRLAGFQRQSPDKGPTVQGTLEVAFQRIAGVPITVEGAGRTDSGVHASGQVVNAHVPERLDPATWQRALNALLPADVAIRAICAVPDTFRARRSAVARSYRYRILCDAIRSPLRERYAWRVPAPLDMPVMAQAVALLPGERDFGAFGSSPLPRPDGSPGHTVRTLLVAECGWCPAAGGAPGQSERGDEIAFRFTANAFLSGMVRRLVGTLVLVGEGRLSLADFQAILEARDKNHPGTAAPACGLCLTGVEYPFGLVTWSSELLAGNGVE